MALVSPPRSTEDGVLKALKGHVLRQVELIGHCRWKRVPTGRECAVLSIGPKQPVVGASLDSPRADQSSESGSGGHPHAVKLRVPYRLGPRQHTAAVEQRLGRIPSAAGARRAVPGSSGVEDRVPDDSAASGRGRAHPRRIWAFKAKVRPGYVAQPELGLRPNPSLDVVRWLARAPGVRLGALLG